MVTKDADGDGTISDSEKSGSSVTDLVFEMENLQFSDTVARTDKQISADDYDHDFVIDVAEILGAIGNDSFKSNASGLNSILPDWVLDQEGGSGNEAAALKALFEADNFFDGGAGRDDIHAGAGDDTIDPGAKSGDAGDVVDGGDGMDVLILSGKSTDWTTDANGDSSTDVGVGTYAGYDLTGFTMYTNKNGTTSDTSDDWVVYVKNIEAIEFEDVFQSLQTTVKDIDQDGDGIVDQVMVKGAATAETVTGSVVEGQDVDSIAAAAAITNAANPITLAAGDEDGFFSGSASAGALSLSGALVSSSIGDTGGKLVSIKSNADDSGLKFTVTGTDLEGNPQTEVVTGPDTGAVNTTKVFKTVEKIVSSGNSTGTIKAGVASGGKLGDGQYVTITSAGNDKDIEFTVTGKDKDGNVQVEVIGGTNIGEVVGGKLFTEVTSVKASAATAGTISVGSVDQYVSKEDFIDAGAGDDVISAGDGGDIIIGGAGSDFMFGGANSGTDENGDPNKDVAKFNGRLTSVDLDGDGSISDAESADYSIAQNGFIICNGIIDSNGVCILTTLSGSTTAADDDAVVNGAAKLNAAGDLAGISSTTVNSAVTLKSAGDDSGVTFTITGTDEAGATITEKVTGAKTGVAYGKKVFKTVTKVSADKATANTVSVGKDAVVAKSEDRIGDNEIDATTKPTIFTSASTAIAVKVAHDYDNNGDNQKDTFEVAGRADGVSLKASISGSANLALTGSEASGGSVKCMESQNVKIKSYGNDSSINFTVTGTDDSGATITEVIKGSNQGEAIGSKLFKTITQIATNGSSAADVEVGLTSFYLDLDGDNKADLLTDGKFLNDLNGDGDYTDAGEYEISLDTNKMSVDEIVVATLDVDGDGNTNENGDVAGHQIFDAHEIRPVYEITDLNNKDSNDNPIKDWAIEIEEFEFTDGKVQTGPTKQSQVTFSITEGITEEVDHVGSNFADEIISGTTKDFMTGGGGADYFVFGTGTGVDTIKDFVAKAVTDDSGNITTHADVIKILKNVNGQSLDTASQAKGRASSTTNGTRIDLGNGNSITLEGVNSSDLTDANFMVVDVL